MTASSSNTPEAARPRANVATDPRIDPRIRAVFAQHPRGLVLGDAESREALLAEENSEAGRARAAAQLAWFELMCDPSLSADVELEETVETFHSTPEGNEIKLLTIRPKGSGVLPCVYYLHGGGQTALSCFDRIYHEWGRLIAAQGVAVAMPDFRNALRPSSAGVVAPFPAGLNDCVSGLKWVAGEAERLRIDATRLIVAGESGGGNLAIATCMALKRTGDLGMVHGLYAMCPHIAGLWPQPCFPSSYENEGLFISLHNNRPRMAYGLEAFEARDPLAWPAFAQVEDVEAFPKSVIVVNECDPLRDEGIAFFRLLLAANVAAQGVQLMGTIHGTEIFSRWCPEISCASAKAIADLARSPS